MLTISHGTQYKVTANHNGYGYATEGMLGSLNNLGYEVTQNDPKADVQIWFDQPHHWKWDKGSQYRIGYCPWESTEIHPFWLEKFNECDEVWTPSPLIAQWYRECGIMRPVYVYQHGVDKIWTPKQRVVDDKFRFLHVDGGSLRKGAFQTINAVRTAFVDNDDVELVMKISSSDWKIPTFGKNVIINRMLTTQEMVELYHDSHAYVYPSYGEGFGLTPLQSMATGMPTISTAEWAPYKDLMDERLIIGSQLRKSPWQEVHPGKMFRPNFDEMVDILRWTYDNYSDAQAYAHAQVPEINTRFDWDSVTKDVFDDLEKRLKIS